MLLEGSLSILCPSQLNFPEGVAVDVDGAVWAGGAAGEVYRITGDLFVVPLVKLSGRLLGITPAIGGGVLVCAMDEHRVVRVEADGTVTQVGPGDIPLPNCTAYDQHGNVWITDSGEWVERDGRVLRVDGDGNSTVAADGLAFANGLAFSADWSTLYVAQSEDRDVVAFDVAADGTLSNRRVAISREALGAAVPGDPLTDGVAVDEAGNVYVTLPRADRVVVATPDGRVEVVCLDDGPAKDTAEIDHGQVLRSPTNVAFGGADRRDLYVANLRTRHLAVGRVAVPGLELPGQRR
ncbi:SMP-30/gluconolactonase/LRE family protein [Pseudonocardia benzenivorans]|jgi:gluconolactonase|uniref:SMP-30/gluconolactonase/LRE family protein n=1 Tax=Pseudonocardia benzenivorans TaxID=228005 RepID=A0ABW3VEN8_9PSEU|nr:hypothetical protein PSD17_66850 [Pseudonocardia sp. D17]